MGQLRSNGSLGIRWSVSGVACSAFGSYALQKAGVESTGEEYMVKDAAGNTRIWYGFDAKQVFDLEYIVTGASANISASVTKPGFGDLLVITDTLNNITGSAICQSSKLDLSNTEGAKVVVKATEFTAGGTFA